MSHQKQSTIHTQLIPDGNFDCRKISALTVYIVRGVNRGTDQSNDSVLKRFLFCSTFEILMMKMYRYYCAHSACNFCRGGGGQIHIAVKLNFSKLFNINSVNFC